MCILPYLLWDALIGPRSLMLHVRLLEASFSGTTWRAHWLPSQAIFIVTGNEVNWLSTLHNAMANSGKCDALDA